MLEIVKKRKVMANMVKIKNVIFINISGNWVIYGLHVQWIVYILEGSLLEDLYLKICSSQDLETTFISPSQNFWTSSIKTE